MQVEIYLFGNKTKESVTLFATRGLLLIAVANENAGFALVH